MRPLVYHGTLVQASTFTGTRSASGQTALFYSAEDYARDMADRLALRVNCAQGQLCGPGTLYNPDEPAGNLNAIIYTVGLGPNVTFGPDRSGELLLRYLAAVGDDGNRVTDPCLAAPSEPLPRGEICGNYRFAPDAFSLWAHFYNIAVEITGPGTPEPIPTPVPTLTPTPIP